MDCKSLVDGVEYYLLDDEWNKLNKIIEEVVCSFGKYFYFYGKIWKC